jgi:hypothetical protein
MRSSDEIRSLAISQRLLGTIEIILIHHTDCGMLTFTDNQFKRAIRDDTGIKAAWSAEAFPDLDEDVRQSVARIQASPFIPRTGQSSGLASLSQDARPARTSASCSGHSSATRETASWQICHPEVPRFVQGVCQVVIDITSEHTIFRPAAHMPVNSLHRAQNPRRVATTSWVGNPQSGHDQPLMSECRTSPLARRSKPVRVSMTLEYEQHPQSLQSRSLLAAGIPGEVPCLMQAGTPARQPAPQVS